MELNVVENALTELEAEELLPQVAVYNLSAGTPITKEVIEPPKVVIIVLCRLKSTRLPLKAILPIHGVPSIERCLINTLAIPGKHQVILATSDIAQDDPLEKFNLDGKLRFLEVIQKIPLIACSKLQNKKMQILSYGLQGIAQLCHLK